jgi:hypothetical protein
MEKRNGVNVRARIHTHVCGAPGGLLNFVKDI